MAFDWDDFKIPDDVFVRFEPGVHVEGRVTQLGQHSFDGKTFHPEVTIQLDDGTDRVVTASNVQLLKLFKEHKPQVGDRLSVICTGETQLSGGRTMKNYVIDVASPGDRPRGHAHRPDPPAAPDDEVF